MTKNKLKIFNYCLILLMSVASSTMIAEAYEIPVAGIDIVLNSYYNSKSDGDVEILSTNNSQFNNIGIAQVTNYVNIRSEASEESNILGKLYNNSAATILGSEDNWYKVKSGSVNGYVKKDYLATGSNVEALAKVVGKRIATVDTTTLKVREKPSLNAQVLMLIPMGESFTVKEEIDGWVKIAIDSLFGFVSSDYVIINTEFNEAISIKEEQERLEKEIKKTQQVKKENESSGKVKIKSSKSYDSSLRKQIVDYALKFEGNPYVWGGTSLTNGADCSGFTQSVYRDNGISISRTSKTQANSGREISLDKVQPGDLIFYGHNRIIDHVAIYIGNGKIISASNKDDGIKVSNYKYRQPYKVVNYID